jgi:hypothetical protein
VFIAVLLLTAACGGEGHDTSARSAATPTASSSTTADRLSRSEFLIFAGNVCTYLADAPSYAHDFSQAQTERDREGALRSLAAVLDTTRSHAVELSKANAPSALRSEYKRRLVPAVAQIESATKELLAEFQRTGTTRATVTVTLRHLHHGTAALDAYGRKYRLSECHV